MMPFCIAPTDIACEVEVVLVRGMVPTVDLATVNYAAGEDFSVHLDTNA